MHESFFSESEKNSIRSRLWRERNADKVKADDKARYAQNREQMLARSKQWQRDNREKHAANKRAYRARHRERLAAERAAHRQANLDEMRAYERQKRRNNPGGERAKQARRRASELQATPVWVDYKAIKRIYDLAVVLGLTVDHIEPLQGKNACGLHVPWNLQLLTFSENSAKGNRSPSENLSCVSYFACGVVRHGVEPISSDASRLPGAGPHSQ